MMSRMVDKAPEDVELGIAGKHVLPQVVSGIVIRVGWVGFKLPVGLETVQRRQAKAGGQCLE
jgi:hypothetical protein